MGRYIITTLMFVLVGIACLAQQNTSPWDASNFLEGISDLDANFYEVKAAGEAYFAQDSNLRKGNSFGYKDFKRFVNFWEPRTFTDGTLNGDLNQYHKLIYEYSQNRSLVCDDQIGISGLYNWNFMGPKDIPDQWLGMITSVAYFNDNGNDVFFAGSSAGGIFRAAYDPNDPVVTWEHISEDILVPGIGFSDLEIVDDSDNSGKRYLLAGSGLLHRNYSRGIFLLDLNNPNAVFQEVTNLPDPNKGVFEELVNQIAAHPTDKSIVFALIGSSLYSSDSYGEAGSWELKFSVSDVASQLSHVYPNAVKLSKLIFHPANPDIMYISSYTTLDPCQVPPLIFKTTDGGTTWNVFAPSNNLLSNYPTQRIDIATASYLEFSGDDTKDPIYVFIPEIFNCQSLTPSYDFKIIEFNNTTNQF